MNTFGQYFRVTTFGESHGPAVGAVVDGVPEGIEFGVDHILPYLKRRKTGKKLTSKRNEPDIPVILSGIHHGKTTGMPIAMIVYNVDQKSSDYDDIAHCYRPGHADYSYAKKYKNHDHRGGGRSSGRETIGRVLAGALACTYLATQHISITSTICSIHKSTDPETFPDIIQNAYENGDSVGGVIEIIAHGIPPGIGDPVFGKLDALLGAALLSIGSIKAVEIGDGITAASAYGSEHNDQMQHGQETVFASNHAGGILGGISTGSDIILRAYVKPTPSIQKSQKTIDIHGTEQTISISGRHDPCIALRIGVICESMVAIVLLDRILSNRALFT